MSEQPAAAPAAASNPRLVVHAVLRTDVGKVRAENQDFGIYTDPSEERGSHPGGRLFVVADGMGGHRGGATASRIAGETVKAQYLGSETTDIAKALRDSLTRANARIYSEAQANPDLRGMGTTTSALAVRGTHAWFAHVGDSRIYLVRGDEIRQLTDDHSLVASMVREGLLTTKEAENHPRRNVLQRSMGVAEDVEIDVRGPFDIREGDIFILCSDGLHGLVKEPELKEIAKLPLEEAADEFLRRTLDRGAPDNVTVIVARVDAATAEDDVLEETQPVRMPVDPTLYDETQRDTMAFDETTRDRDRRPQEEIDTAKVPAYRDDDDAEVAAAPAVAPDAAPMTALEPPGEVPPLAAMATDPVSTATTLPQVAAYDDVEPAAPGSMLKWMLLVVLALGAAGAWLFLTR